MDEEQIKGTMTCYHLHRRTIDVEALKEDMSYVVRKVHCDNIVREKCTDPITRTEKRACGIKYKDTDFDTYCECWGKPVSKYWLKRARDRNQKYTTNGGMLKSFSEKLQ